MKGSGQPSGTPPTCPLVLFSGLAADASVFAPQQLVFPQLVVPAWPRPERGESLADYSARLAEDLQEARGGVLGGASFGGIVALHVAQHLSPRAVVLIGSMRSPEELPRYARLSRPLRYGIPLLPVRLLQWLAAPVAAAPLPRVSRHLRGLARQFRRSDPRVLGWSLRELLSWDATPQLDCPVFQIHGQRDWVLPVGNTRPDRIVPGGGHVISLTHPHEVTEFIDDILTHCGAR